MGGKETCICPNQPVSVLTGATTGVKGHGTVHSGKVSVIVFVME